MNVEYVRIWQVNNVDAIRDIHVPSETKVATTRRACKIVRDGRLLIQLGDRTYTTAGLQMRD